MRIKKFLVSIAAIGFISYFPAQGFSETTDRMDLISKELDCVAAHEQKGAVDWNDVCYSSSNNREQKIAKAMDQVVKEHQQMSDEMLSDNDREGAKSIDELIQQENDYYGVTSADNADNQSQSDGNNTKTAKSVEDVYQQEVDYYGTTSADYSDDRNNKEEQYDQHQYQSKLDIGSESGGDIDDPYDSKVHELDLGREDYYYHYEEDIPISIGGWMHGYYGNYTYRPEEGNLLNNEIINMYKFEGHYLRGDLDYKGSGVDNGRTNKMYELRALLGKDYVLDDRSQVTPYVGFGYRYLIDRGGGRLSSTNNYGYNRESHYYYLPIGCFVNIPAPNDWNIGLNIEYDFFWQGVQKSRLSDGDQFNGLGNDDLRNHQDKGFGLRGSVKFFKKTSLFDLYVEPFIRYWSIADSKVQTGMVEGSLISGLEPKNNTTEIGSKIGLQF